MTRRRVRRVGVDGSLDCGFAPARRRRSKSDVLLLTTALLRRLSLCACLGAAALVAAESAKPSMKTTPGGSFVVSAAAAPRHPTPVGERADYVDAPTKTLARFEAHRTTLLPGRASHAPHRHEREEFTILLSGALDVFVEGQTTRLTAGSMWWVASNDPHNATATADAPATYLVMNFYPAAAPARPAAAAPAKPIAASTLWEWTKLEVKPTKTGERREVIDAPTRTLVNFECHLTTLRPGNAPHAGHHHPDEEILVVKEGTMEAVVGGETHRLGPGDFLYVVSGEEHGWRNVGDTPATYYVIRFISTATPPKTP